MTHHVHVKFHSEALLEELEARQLFSGGIEGILADNNDAETAVHMEVSAEPELIDSPNSIAISVAEIISQELVFIDTDVTNYQQLLNDIIGQSDEDRNIEVILLDNQRDGIEQITEALASFQNLDAVHLISHGSGGSVDIGNSRLDSESVSNNLVAISDWANAFSENGDFLIYGCNLAENEEGQSLVNALSALTQTDVAASEDLTGNVKLGGDWDLEYVSGSIEADMAVSQNGQQEWLGVLNASPTDILTSGALNLDSSPNGISGTSLTLNQGAAFTVQMEINPARIDAAGWSYGLLTRNVTPTDNGFYLEVVDEKISYSQFDSGSLQGKVESSIGDLVVGNWQTVTLTIDAGDPSVTDDSTATIYVDAIQVGTITGLPEVDSSSQELYFLDYFDGDVREVRFFDSALSSAQIAGSLNTNYDGTEAGLVLLYDFEDGTGTTVTDRSLSGHDGTIGNATTNWVAINVVPEASVAGTVVGFLSADDPDANDTLTYSIQSDPSGNFEIVGREIRVSPTATLNYESASTHVITVRVTDSGTPGLMYDEDITIQLNKAPTTGNAGSGSPEDSASITINLNGSDVDGTVTHFKLNTLPTNGNLYLDSGLTALVNANQDYARSDALLPMYFVPDANWVGSTSFTYLAKDDSGQYSRSPGTVTINVTPVNDAPIATGGGVTGTEDTAYVMSWSDFNLSDIDTLITSQTAVRIDSLPVSGTLQFHNGSTWIAVSSGQLLTKATVAAGSVRFVPLADEAGADSYYNSGLGNGFNDYAQFSYTPIHSTSLNINNANAESLMVPEEGEVLVNTGTTQWSYLATGNGGGVYNPTTTDFPTDSDNALFTTGNEIIYQTLSATFSSSNDYSLSLDIGWANFNTSAPTFRIELWAGGAQLGFIDNSHVTLVKGEFVSGTLSIDGSAFSVLDGQPLEIRLIATNSSPENYFDNLVLTEFDRTYDVGDAGSVMNIDITPVNDVPVAIANTVTTNEDSAYTFSVGDFTYTDVDSDALATVTIRNLNLAGGTLILSGLTTVTDGMIVSRAGIPQLIYTPANNASGAPLATFDFTVNDVGQGIVSAQMDINVSAVNDAPSLSISDGIATENIGTPSNMVIQADGKILVTGTKLINTNNGVFLARYNTDGTLDISFGSNGVVETEVSANLNQGYNVSVQSDGKIVVVGRNQNGTDDDVVLIRYASDGSLDLTFGINGIVTTDLGGSEIGYNLAIDTDGKILVSGSSDDDFMLLRYLDNGSLDTSFGANGSVIKDLGGVDIARNVLIQSTGDIVLAGESSGDFAVVRFDSTGVLDISFGTSGVTKTSPGGWGEVLAASMQSDGKIIVTGGSKSNGESVFALIRYTADGDLDTSFNGTGIVTADVTGDSDYATSSTLQSDGKIVVGGYSLTNVRDVALVRYHSDGSLDNTFGDSGKVTLARGLEQTPGESISVQADGSIVFSVANDFKTGLVRLDSNGVLDTGFGLTSAYTEGGNPVELVPELVLRDIDDTHINAATVQITANYQNPEDILVFTDTATITGSWDTVAGTLTLSGSDTLANYEIALRSITYANSSDAPSEQTRTVSFTVNDSSDDSNIVTRDISVLAVNDAPTITKENVFSDSGQAFANYDTKSIAMGDVDGDGDLDMVVANFNQPNTVLLNDGNGNYADSGQALGILLFGAGTSVDIQLGDVDGDGDLDIVVANNSGSNKLYFNNGSGVFSDSGQNLDVSASTSIVLGDVDNDGDLDMITGNFGQTNTLYINDGDGSFSYSPQPFGSDDTMSVALGDIDGDGDLDLISGDRIASNKIYLNDGRGQYSISANTVGTNTDTRAVTLADIDNDGDLDLIEANYSDSNKVFINDGAGVFANVQVLAPGTNSLSVATGDIDNDGDIDLVFGNNGQFNKILRNDGAGNFSASFLGNAINNTNAVNLADINGDGDLDIIVGNDSAQINKVYDNLIIALDEGQSAVTVVTVREISDIDSIEFDGGNLTIAYSISGDAGDQLSINNQGMAAGQIAFDGSNIRYQGTLIGAVSLTDNGLNGNDLVIALNANATPIATAALVNNITFQNTSGAPAMSRTLSITVNDGDGGISKPITQLITIKHINDAPTANIDLGTTNEDTSLMNINVLGNDTDVEGDTLTVTVASAASGTVIINGDDTLSYSPNSNFNGIDTISYSISDGNGGVAIGTVTVTVNAVNDEPSFTAPANQSVVYESGAHTVANFITFIAGGGSDENAQAFTYSVLNNNAGLFSVAPSIDIDGQLTYTVETGQAGTATVTVFVTDSGGTANSGDDISVSQTFDITVAANTAPTITAIANQTIDEDVATAALAFTVADADATAGTLIVTATSSNTALIPDGNLVLANDGVGNWTIAATPLTNQNGSTTITVTVNDGTTTNNKTFDIAVTAVNDAPTVANTISNQTATEDGVFSFQFASNTFNDVDGDSLTYTSDVAGWLSFDAVTRTFSGTPLNADVGTTTVTVTASDGNGGTVTESFDIVTGNTSDAATIAGVDTGIMQEDVSVLNNNISTSGLLTISDDDVGEAIFVAETLTGSYGELVMQSDGNWTYTANNAQTSIQRLGLGESITETITVSSADNTTHNVVITINGTDDVSVIAGTVTGSVTEDGALSSSGSLTLSDIDSSDSAQFADVIAQVGDHGYGTFSIIANTWAFTLDNNHAAVQALDSGEVLTDTYTFVAPDGVTQQVTVTINGAEDIPVFNLTAVTTATEGDAYRQIITVSDVDIEAVSITADSLPAWLNLIDNGDGSAILTGTPGNAEVGGHSVVLSVSDGSVSSSWSFTVSVASSHDEALLFSHFLEEPGFSSTAMINESRVAKNAVSAVLNLSAIDTRQEGEVEVLQSKKIHSISQLFEDANGANNIEEDEEIEDRIKLLDDSSYLKVENNVERWNKSQLLILNEIDLQLDRDDDLFELSEIKANQDLWNNIDLMREQMNADTKQLEKQDFEIEFVAVTTIGITAGFVNWVLRGGTLLSSLLSSASLFKQFDPLAVVFTQNKTFEKTVKTGGADDESDVEKLFDKNNEI